jgi:acylphosphatase
MSGKNLGYKYLEWINQNANNLGLKGITFFGNDGSIKIIAEGEEGYLNIFISRLQRGRFFFPIFYPVENFYITWQEPKNEFEDFSISEATE